MPNRNPLDLRYGIGVEGWLKPWDHVLLGARLAWMTTERNPDRELTGLGMTHTTCDRMLYCYEILEPTRCTPWLSSLERAKAPRDIVHDLEDYGDPEHWWITSEPVLAKLLVDEAQQ